MASLTLEDYSGLPHDEFVGRTVSSAHAETKIVRRQHPNGEIANERGTGLSQLDRLLDPKNTAVSLVTLARAAALSGKRLVVEIRDQHPVKVIEPKAKK
jgi:antitoxin HicB